MREIKMARTVWANMELAKICPGNDVSRIMELLGNSDFSVQIETTLNIIKILNMAWEKKEKANNPNYVPNPITDDELLNATEEELAAALNRALETFHNDGEQTVEAEPKKSKKKATK